MQIIRIDRAISQYFNAHVHFQYFDLRKEFHVIENIL